MADHNPPPSAPFLATPLTSGLAHPFHSVQVPTFYNPGMSLQLSAIKTLIGSNFDEWYESLSMFLVLESLPYQFDAFKTSYNTQKEVRDLSIMSAIVIQEEEILKTGKSHYVLNMTLDSTASKKFFSKDRGWKGSSGMASYTTLIFLTLALVLIVSKGSLLAKIRKDRVIRSQEVLGLIHTDICEPFTPIALGGYKYFITFIDDYSRYGHMELICEKSDSLYAFKVFKSAAELLKGKKIKADCGIEAQYTMLGTPEQNGVAERRIHTLLDMVRSQVCITSMAKSLSEIPLGLSRSSLPAGFFPNDLARSTSSHSLPSLHSTAPPLAPPLPTERPLARAPPTAAQQHRATVTSEIYRVLMRDMDSYSVLGIASSMVMNMMASSIKWITSAGEQAYTSLPCFSTTSTRKRILVFNVRSKSSSKSNAKIANFSAARKERIKLPDYDGGCHISDFLRHPSGIQAMLNTSALHTFQCTLPKVQLLNFEVAPVIDLRVTPTTEDCLVELLSCKFEGSDIVERQNDHFSSNKCMNIAGTYAKSFSKASTSHMDGSSEKGKKCKLLHWMGNGEVVAEAEVDCTDPQAVVHHMILGSDCWRVSVKKVLVSKVPLYRATTAFMIL
ncbi:hypothetical protein JRO89_XS01G0104900 [Xanthoceras sorbifolium]|uniref:Uncharacterized protein n=1 Tax=Xanthoceras sorbifolium TaxID=99658 RepID=A0ABQ8IIL4_9ROSI|nr:hypothetical protein JRO89_XS01G0104900 [Xanthoceras sorbifolium]